MRTNACARVCLRPFTCVLLLISKFPCFYVHKQPPSRAARLPFGCSSRSRRVAIRHGYLSIAWDRSISSEPTLPQKQVVRMRWGDTRRSVRGSALGRRTVCSERRRAFTRIEAVSARSQTLSRLLTRSANIGDRLIDRGGRNSSHRTRVQCSAFALCVPTCNDTLFSLQFRTHVLEAPNFLMLTV